jgi:hypothetical protein
MILLKVESPDNERVSQIFRVFVCEMDSEMDRQMDSFSCGFTGIALRSVPLTAVRMSSTSNAYACSL